MEPLLLEISIGTILAGSALYAYIIKIKKRIKKRILRDYEEEVVRIETQAEKSSRIENQGR